MSIGEPSFFTILGKDKNQLFAPITFPKTIVSTLKFFYLKGASGIVVDKIPPIFPNTWAKTCLSVNTTSGLFQWVIDGTYVMTTVSEEVKSSKEKPKNLSKKVVLGARAYAGGWRPMSSKVTDLNIFSSALSVEKMVSMTSEGTCAEEGDYLAWRDMEWILHGQAKIEVMDQEESCKGDPYVTLFYTQFKNMEACSRHCAKLGSRMPVVTEWQDWVKLRDFLKKEIYDKGRNSILLWLPVSDREQEGEWRDFYNASMIQNFTPPWSGSRPDGGDAQNCAFIYGDDIWGDVQCDYANFACMCTQYTGSYLELKGLLPSSLIDRYYKLISDPKDMRMLKYQGLEQTVITYDSKKEMWTLDTADSKVSGISKASHVSFTLGKHNWTITDDKGFNEGESYTRELKMSGCQKGEFTCNDGQCVSMQERCNQLPDCKDKSDEMNCKILVLEEGYNMDVPPIISSEPAFVSVSIDLLKLVSIDEEDYSIEIQFEISLVWKEKRVTYQNLKQRSSLNALQDKDIKSLWLPKVIFENTDQRDTTRLGEYGGGEWETRVIVQKEQQNGTMSSPESVDEAEIFSGFENSLVMNQTYTRTFQCNYEFSHYPFDTQV